MKYLLSFVSIYMLLLVSCQSNQVQGSWIKGNEKEKIEKIEWQFRGFDKAMIETDYRYQELYWAGRDQNWEYADYLNKKIKKAIETGLQRRPKRAKSAQTFLSKVLPEMQEAIISKDSTNFFNAFDSMTQNCNACHALEKLPFFTVKTPLKRHSSIRK
jgi:hypothetical protein